MIWVFWCLTIKSQPKHPPICFGVRNVFTFICQRGKKKSEILRKWVVLTKCFGEGWGLTSQRLSSRLPRAQRESHGCDAIKAKKTWLRPIASYVRCASQRDATNGMNALPAHSPVQSVVRPLSDVGEPRTGREPERFRQSEAVSTVEKVWLVPRSSSQPATN